MLTVSSTKVSTGTFAKGAGFCEMMIDLATVVDGAHATLNLKCMSVNTLPTTKTVLFVTSGTSTGSDAAGSDDVER